MITQGAIYLVNARLKFRRNEPYFGYNKALEGSGGAMYFGSVPELTIGNASLVGNVSELLTNIHSTYFYLVTLPVPDRRSEKVPQVIVS